MVSLSIVSLRFDPFPNAHCDPEDVSGLPERAPAGLRERDKAFMRSICAQPFCLCINIFQLFLFSSFPSAGFFRSAFFSPLFRAQEQTAAEREERREKNKNDFRCVCLDSKTKFTALSGAVAHVE